MNYEKLIRCSDLEFKRLVGVPRPLIKEMVRVVAHAESLKAKSACPHSLSLKD